MRRAEEMEEFIYILQVSHRVEELKFISNWASCSMPTRAIGPWKADF
jgi:hypothetical protein